MRSPIFVRGAIFLAAAMAQDSGPLHIQYNVEMTGGISVMGPAVKERIIYGGSCAQPPTPLHIWNTKVARIQVAFNIVLAGITGETGIPPSGTPWTHFEETSSVGAETGQTDDLIFGVNGTRNATGTVLYRPDGSGLLQVQQLEKRHWQTRRRDHLLDLQAREEVNSGPKRAGGNLAPSYRFAAPSRRWRPRARTRANSGEPGAVTKLSFHNEGQH